MDTLGGHAITGQLTRGGRTGHDHAARGGQCASLAVEERAALLCAQAGFQRKRVMDQRHPAQPCRMLLGQAGHGPERQTIGDDQRAIPDARQLLRGAVQRSSVRPGETGIQRDDVDLAACLAQSGDHLAVIAVAAGDAVQLTGHHEDQLGCGHGSTRDGLKRPHALAAHPRRRPMQRATRAR